ncbi:hypothetical protein [Siphonobacter sp. SORGH_AS_1065]|nr:hypothetical protein [Siphonobacter sp. SORGH_AS_1065]MDQ1088588.1 hypothetical protein [Siphonobacter sp. SORGH_AS_1065]
MTNSNSDETRRIRTTIPYEPEKDEERLLNKFERKAAWKDRMKALRNSNK